MGSIPNLANESPKELLDAQTHVWNNVYSFINSMSLRCALQLGILDAMQQHGKPITINELANLIAIHPNKTQSFTRLMRLLVHSNFFSTQILPSGEQVFDLTLNSRILLKDHPLTLAPYVLTLSDPFLIEPFYHFHSWFHNEIESPFNMVHKRSIWEYASSENEFNKLLNESMASDARFMASLLTKNNEFRGIFQGLESLVDVGGGDGSMAMALTKVFPKLTCIVLDLPHVVEGVKGNESSNVQFVGGDMFEVVPQAQAVLLKSVLHDWTDEQCVKILERCKEAIPNKEEGGKIIIIDMVVETKSNYSHSQLLLDMLMMNLTPGGKERNEIEWKNIFERCGFTEYKISSILGPRSIIEIYIS